MSAMMVFDCPHCDRPVPFDSAAPKEATCACGSKFSYEPRLQRIKVVVPSAVSGRLRVTAGGRE